jgi:hypothetical protein
MKNLSIIILFLFFCQNSACQLKKVSIDSIEKSILKRTKSFAFDTYNAQQEKSLPKLSKSIATKRALELYKYKNFSEQITAISETYGSLLKVDFIEELKNDKLNYFIFRFKAYYKLTDNIAEIRVYLNSENKIDGITFRQIWYDKYYKENEMPPLNSIEIDSIHKAKAYEFANRTFKDCSKGDFLKLTTDNAVTGLMKVLTIQKLKNSCEKLTKEFGNVIDFNLVEILSDNHRIIYRYKAKYTKTQSFLEFKVYTNMEHKFTGIWCEDKWLDKFYEIDKTSKNASR